MLARLSGHFWTAYPYVRNRVVRFGDRCAEPWATTLLDPQVGAVRLTGRLDRVPHSEAAVVVVHGLGGDPESFYCRAAAAALVKAGFTVLRLALRGADGQGEDFYHGAMAEDVHAALQSAELAPYRARFVLGFSVGGHIALHVARSDAVQAVAAVTPPLDLALAQRAIDAGRWSLYRAHVLRSLRRQYAAVAQRRAVPTPVATVARVRRIRDYDALTVVPRYGFRDPDDYYARISIVPHLGALRAPALVVVAEQDPMVPLRVVTPALGLLDANTEVIRIRHGGHVSFPPRARMHAAVVRFFQRAASTRAR